MFIERTISRTIIEIASEFKALTVTGPRQSGKTTLLRQIFPHYKYVNLEDLSMRDFALKDPKAFLEEYSGPAIIDEVQKVPSILSYLQIVLDDSSKKAQYILTGSQNFQLSAAITQSLVGRAALITLLPFSMSEIRSEYADVDTVDIIYKGQYPAIYSENIPPSRYYNAYTSLYLERDVRDIRQVADLSLFRDFMSLVAARTGQLMNLSDLSNVLGRDVNTIKQWLSVLETSYVVFKLRPLAARTARRIARSPKYYFYDTGLLCNLLNIKSTSELLGHPQWGSIFENFVVAEKYKDYTNKGEQPDLHFLRDKTGNEIDVVETSQGKLIYTEIKAAKTFSPDMIKGLDKFDDIAVASNQILEKHIVYRGQSLKFKHVGFVGI